MALSRGFPRVDPSTTLPFDVRTFLEGRNLRGCLICTVNLAGADDRVKTWDSDCDRETPSGPPGPLYTARIRPTTRPSTLTSLLRIGSIVSFSGCNLM